MDTNLSLLERHSLENPRVITKDYMTVVARGELLDKVFALRYKSYYAEGYIEENKTERFVDEYDRQANSRSYLTFYRGQPIGSIRACTFCPGDGSILPVMHPFGEEIARHVGYDKPLIEANRFVIDPDFQRRGGVKARFDMFGRIADSAVEAGAEFIIAAVRPEHVKFYRMRFFEPMADIRPKEYPGLKFKVVLLVCRAFARAREFVWRKSQ